MSRASWTVSECATIKLEFELNQTWISILKSKARSERTGYYGFDRAGIARTTHTAPIFGIDNEELTEQRWIASRPDDTLRMRKLAASTRFSERVLDCRTMWQLLTASWLLDFFPLPAKRFSVFQRFNKWQVPLTRIEHWHGNTHGGTGRRDRGRR